MSESIRPPFTRTPAEVEQDYADRYGTTREVMHAAGIWARKCRCARGTENPHCGEYIIKRDVRSDDGETLRYEVLESYCTRVGDTAH